MKTNRQLAAGAVDRWMDGVADRALSFPEDKGAQTDKHAVWNLDQETLELLLEEIEVLLGFKDDDYDD